MEHIPSKETILDSLIITTILSRRDTNLMGDFEILYQTDPAALEAVEK